jgi:ABC-2 type transport system ATP-binding protein
MIMADAENTAWIIEAQGIGRRFGTQKVLADINLQISEGEIFGLLGPDGAGKTTLMQILAAILDPTEGACRVLGFDTVKQTASITSRIGYMSQGFTLYDRLTVDENLIFSAKIRGIEGSVFQQRRQRLLAMAGLTQFGGRRAGNLSGGMRKKLSLCTNLIHEPPLLLLDELSLGVDPVSRRELWQMLREFRESGATIVVTTPYMDEADYCDRLALLDHGQILALDSPDALRRRGEGTVFELTTNRAEEVLKVLTDRPELSGLQWLGTALHILLRSATTLPNDVVQALQNIGELQPVPASLEDVFVQMTAPESAVQAPAFVPSSPSPDLTAELDVVQLKGVTCRFGDFTAVDNVSLTVPAGEVFGFLGPNGAGKTTLIRAMCALLKPASGELRVAGIDVVTEPMRLRSRIGYMSQRFSLYTELTVAENLSFFAGVYGIDGHPRAEAIA